MVIIIVLVVFYIWLEVKRTVIFQQPIVYKIRVESYKTLNTRPFLCLFLFSTQTQTTNNNGSVLLLHSIITNYNFVINQFYTLFTLNPPGNTGRRSCSTEGIPDKDLMNYSFWLPSLHLYNTPRVDQEEDQQAVRESTQIAFSRFMKSESNIIFSNDLVEFLVKYPF